MLSLLSKSSAFFTRRPLLSNVISTGFLFGSGDFLAQSFFSPEEKYDIYRTLRAVSYGSIVFAPIGFRWYKLLGSIQIPTKSFKSDRAKVTLNTVARVAVDQLVFAPFIGIPLYYSCMALFERKEHPFEEVTSKLNKHWAPTLWSNWSIWPVFQFFNFYLVPLHLRLLMVNLFSIGWNCYLSYRLNIKHAPLLPSEQDVDPEDQVML